MFESILFAAGYCLVDPGGQSRARLHGPEHMESPNPSIAPNLPMGHGYSSREVEALGQ